MPELKQPTLAKPFKIKTPNLAIATLWADEPRATELLNDLQNIAQRRWRCVCGELIEGGFEQCWSCAALMPA